MNASNANVEIFQELRAKLDRKTRQKQGALEQKAHFQTNLLRADQLLLAQLDAVLGRVAAYFAPALDLIQLRALHNMSLIEMEPGREHLVANGSEVRVLHAKITTTTVPNDIVVRIELSGDGQLLQYCLVCTALGSVGAPGEKIRYVDEDGLLLTTWQDQLADLLTGVLLQQIKEEAERDG